jgi:predicted SAM-dependent methyltransferase
MDKLNYLNLGCGTKFHKDWINVDMVSNSNYVIEADLLKGIPFEDNQFEIIYHSQLLEHIPKHKAKDFMIECYRVLNKNGIIRIVVPDLENIVDEYKRLLQCNLESPSDLAEANYDWIMLEMYDQTVRNTSGGQMLNYLRQTTMINEDYVLGRAGFVARLIRNSFLYSESLSKATGRYPLNLVNIVRYIILVTKQNIYKLFTNSIFQSQAYKIGKFKLSGEIHMWMYDRYSLSRLLKDCGFNNIKIMDPYKSDIPNWEVYELDVKKNIVYDPTSLFIEARK